MAIHASAATTAQNDGATGTDAPGGMEDAVLLRTTGTFSGNFTQDDLDDWYKVKLAQARHDPVCVASRFSSGALVDGHLVAVAGDDALEAVGRAVPLRTTHRALASDGFTGGFLRATPQSAPATLLAYDFTLLARGLPELPPTDAGTGGDAGPTLATALPLSGACTSGRLDPAANDTADVFTMSGQLGDRWVFSLADRADSALLQVRSPSGDLVAQILSDGTSAVTLPSTGTYTLTASQSSYPASIVEEYILALCGPTCGPPQEPCEPACITLLGDGDG